MEQGKDAPPNVLKLVVPTRGGGATIELDPGEDAYLELIRAMSKARAMLRPSKHPRVAFFGASRVDPSHATYQKTKWLARETALLGADILTGAGEGLMLGANEGALEGNSSSGAYSIGLSIDGAPDDVNKQLDRLFAHGNFFSRLDEFDLLATLGFVLLREAGIGTDAEAAIFWQLAQFSLLSGRIFVMVGDYWKKRRDLMRETMVASGTVREDELLLPTIVDSEEEVLPIIQEALRSFRARRAAG